MSYAPRRRFAVLVCYVVALGFACNGEAGMTLLFLIIAWLFHPYNHAF